MVDDTTALPASAEDEPKHTITLDLPEEDFKRLEKIARVTRAAHPGAVLETAFRRYAEAVENGHIQARQPWRVACRRPGP